MSLDVAGTDVPEASNVYGLKLAPAFLIAEVFSHREPYQDRTMASINGKSGRLLRYGPFI
jgi:hypothetical protein